MSKRNKQQVSAVAHGGNAVETTAAVIQPAKQPTLLAVSISLFALWFVFLLVTAIFG